MADTIKSRTIRAGNVELNFSVNGAEEALRFFSALEQTARGTNVLQYYKEQAALIDDLTAAYERFSRAGDQSSAEHLANTFNALKAVSKDSVDAIVQDFDRMLPTIQNAINRTISSARVSSVQDFSNMFRGLNFAEAAGVNVESLGGVFSKVLNGAENSALIERINELRRQLNASAEEADALREKLSELENTDTGDLQGRFSALKDRFRAYTQDSKYAVIDFLRGNNIDPNLLSPDSDLYNALNGYDGIFDQIEAGSLGAFDAITKLKSQFSDLFTGMDASQFSSTFEALRTQLDEISGAIREIQLNGVKAVQFAPGEAGGASLGATQADAEAMRRFLDLINETTADTGAAESGIQTVANAIGDMADKLRELSGSGTDGLDRVFNIIRAIGSMNGIAVDDAPLNRIVGAIRQISDTQGIEKLGILSGLNFKSFEGLEIRKTSLANLAAYLPTIANVNVNSLLALQNVDLSKFSDLKVRGGTGGMLQGLAALIPVLSSLTPEGIDAIRRMDLSGLNIPNIQEAPLRTLAELLPQITKKVNVEKLAGLANISWEKLNGLHIDESVLSQIERLTAAIKILEHDRILTQAGGGGGRGGSGGNSVSVSGDDGDDGENGDIRKRLQAGYKKAIRQYYSALRDVDKATGDVVLTDSGYESMSGSFDAIADNANHAAAALERFENAELDGVLTQKQYSDVMEYADEQARKFAADIEKSWDRKGATETNYRYRQSADAISRYYKLQRDMLTGQTDVTFSDGAYQSESGKYAAFAEELNRAKKSFEEYVSAEHMATLTDRQRLEIVERMTRAESDLRTAEASKAEKDAGKTEASNYKEAEAALREYNRALSDMLKFSSQLSDGYVDLEEDENRLGVTAKYKGISGDLEGDKAQKYNDLLARMSEARDRFYTILSSREMDLFHYNDMLQQSGDAERKFADAFISARERILQKAKNADAAIIAGNKAIARSAQDLLNKYNDAKEWKGSKNGKTSEAYAELSKNADEVSEILNKAHSGLYKKEELDAAKERLKELGSEYRKLSSDIRRAGENTGGFMRHIQNLIKQFGYLFSSARIVQMLTRYIRQMAETSVQLESSFAQLKVVTGATESEMSLFAAESVRLAESLGKSVSEVTGSIETFSRLGYSLADSSKLAEYATILSNVADVDMTKATSGLTSIIKGFHDLDVENVEHVSDVLIDVGRKYAVSSSEMLEAFEKSSAALDATGTSFEKSVGLVAAANAAVQNASTVGTALKTVSARIRGSKTELDELGEESGELAKGFSKYASEIQQITGFSILEDGTEDTFKDIYDIFGGISQVWDKLSDTQQSRVAEILGGTRQLQVISSIISNWGDAAGAYEDAMNAAGISAEANAIVMDTTQAKLNQLKTTFEDLSMTVMDSDIMKGGVDFLRTLLSAANAIAKITDALGGLKTIVAVILPILAYKKGASLVGTLGGFISHTISDVKGFIEIFSEVKKSVGGAKGVLEGLKAGFTGLSGAASTAQIALTSFAAAISAILIIKTAIDNHYSKIIENAEASITNAAEKMEKLKEQVSAINELRQLYDLDKNGYMGGTEEDEAAYQDAIQRTNDLLGDRIQIIKELSDLQDPDRWLELYNIEHDAADEIGVSISDTIVSANRAIAATVSKQRLNPFSAFGVFDQYTMTEDERAIVDRYLDIPSGYSGTRKTKLGRLLDAGYNLSGSRYVTEYKEGGIRKTDEEISADTIEYYKRIKTLREELIRLGKTDGGLYKWVDEQYAELNKMSDLFGILEDVQTNLSDVFYNSVSHNLSGRDTMHFAEMILNVPFDIEEADMQNSLPALVDAFANRVRDSGTNLSLSDEELKAACEKFLRDLPQFKRVFSVYDSIGATDERRGKFGNVDLRNRQMLVWNEGNLSEYRSAIESHGLSVDELRGSVSTVLGGGAEYNGVEVAYTPILQTDNGPVLLSQNTVDRYINSLFDKANEDGEWTDEELFRLDVQGLEIDGVKVRGLLAAIGDDAEEVGEKMHLISIGQDGVDLDKTGFINAASDMAKGFAKLQSIYNDVKDGDSFDWTSIYNNKDFEEAFKDYTDEYRDFLTTVSESPKDIAACQAAFDKLADAFVKGSGVLDDLSDKTRAAAVNFLETNGITNAEEIIDYYLGLKNAFTDLIYAADFQETFKDAGSALDAFNKTVQESPTDIDACGRALADLIQAYAETKIAAGELTDGVETEIIAILEAAGAANAGETAARILAVAKEKAKIASENLSVAELTNRIRLLDEKNASDATRAALYQLAQEKLKVAAAQIDTTSDIKQLIGLANAAGASAGAIVTLSKVMSNYETASAEAQKGTVAGFHMIDSAQSELLNLQKQIAEGTFDWGFKLNADDFISPTYSPPSATYSPGDSGSKSGSSGKSEEDKAKEIADKAANAFGKIIDYRIKMLKTELDKMKEFLSKKLENLRKIYDDQKEMIQKQLDQERYLADQEAKRTTVSDLQASLQQLERDDSTWAQKRRIEIAKELADAQKDLSDFERDHAAEETMDMLDKTYEAQERIINADIEKIDNALNDPGALFNQALFDIRGDTGALYEMMVDYNRLYGSGEDKEIKEMWDAAKEAMNAYKEYYNADYYGISLKDSKDVDPRTNDLFQRLSVAKEFENEKHVWEDTNIILSDIKMLLERLTGHSITDYISEDAGYASGTENAAAGLHRVFERGSEYIFSSANGKKYKLFSGGEKVLNANATNFLYRFANGGESLIKRLVGNAVSGVGSLMQSGAQNNSFTLGNIVINGNADEKTVSEIRRAQRDQVTSIMKSLKALRA